MFKIWKSKLVRLVWTDDELLSDNRSRKVTMSHLAIVPDVNNGTDKSFHASMTHDVFYLHWILLKVPSKTSTVLVLHTVHSLSFICHMNI